MAALTLRLVKGSPLTNAELDANFSALNTELGQKLVSSDLSPYLLSSTAASTYQPILVSGTSIKTVNGTSLLGSGDVSITAGVSSFNTRTGAITLSSADVTTALGFTPVNNAGDTMTGKLSLPAATTSAAPLNIGVGAGTVAPSAPVAGDIWINAINGMFFRIGSTNYGVAAVNSAQTFTAAQTFSSTISASSTISLTGSSGTNTTLGTGAIVGTLTLGGTSQTGSQTVGQSSATHTFNLATGATLSGSIKTLNIGTGGQSGSSTSINIGATSGTTVSAYGAWTFVNTITGSINGNAATATTLATGRNIALTGDVTGTASFNGSADASISATLANSGVTAGTYTKVTVDAKGRVTTGASLVAGDIPSLSYLALSGGTLTSTNSTGTLVISDSGTSGANIKLTGNGATTPSKTIRAFSGNFSIVNNAYSAEIFTLSDAGVITNSTWNGAAVGVAYGGTGATTLTGLIKGNGTSAFTAAVAGTDYVVPSALSSYAPLASPTFTGTPAAPTAAVDTNTTQIATTAYVIGQGYLKSATAASTYQTQAGMSSYLTTSSASSTYLPLAGGTLTGNLSFSGSNLRITGDFTSATRMYVQTSTANGNTFFALLPNGTATNSQLQVFGSSDPANAPFGTLTINSGTLQIQSAATGTGTLLPFRVMMSTTEAMRVSTAANVLIGTTTDNATDKLQVNGTISATGFTGNASTASKWLTARTETLSGDVTGSASVDGSANWTITTTLANSGVVAGTYGSATNIPQIAVDAKGRITSVSNVAVSIPSGSLTFTGDVTGTGSTGSTTTLTLANSGVTAGTYTNATVTVDGKGRVTSASSGSAGVAAVDGMLVHTNTIASNYTLAASNNAISAGPITINSGVTVTVSTGATWSIV